jgi:hypothetical protein
MQNLKRVLEIRHDENGRHNKSTPLDYASSSALQCRVNLKLLGISIKLLKRKGTN